MYALLIGYWVIFWRKHLQNPYLLCTSEVASTFFPHWMWVGRELRAGRFPSQDNIYYKLPGSIPFLSTFYPPSLLAAWLSSGLELDKAFKVYAYLILGHYLVGSLFAYWMFSGAYGHYAAMFGAITLTYSGYMIKPNTPCFTFSACWVPLAMMGGWVGAIGWAMALAGGYFPILVYIAPVIATIHPLSFLGGCFLALPQLLPFLGYFKRSIRTKEKTDRNFGKLPFLMLTQLINPLRFIGTVNGVHYPEVMMYMGLAPLLIFHASWWLVPLIFALSVSCGLVRAVQRIPARSIYLLSLSIAFLSSLKIQYHHIFPLLLIQGFLLLKNSSIYPSFPFNQWWNRPSKLYHQKAKSYNWPYVTGYLEGRRVSDYVGAFRLAD